MHARLTQSFTPLTGPDRSSWKPMPQVSPSAQSLPKNSLMEYTPSHSTPVVSIRLRRTTTPMTKNLLASFLVSSVDDHSSLAQHTQSPFAQTTKTSNTSVNHRRLQDDKRVGSNSSKTLTTHLNTYLDLPTPSQTFSHAEKTLTRGWIPTCHAYCSQTTSSLEKSFSKTMQMNDGKSYG